MKIISWVLSAALLISAIIGIGIVVSETPISADLLTYELILDGTAYKVTGFLDDEAKSIKIPDFYKDLPVAEIGGSAFSELKSLQKVVFGKNVKKIGDSAFALCDNLNKIELNDGLEHIGERAFGCYYWSDLWGNFDIDAGAKISVFIPLSVKYIGRRAFSGRGGSVLYCAATSTPEAWDRYWNSHYIFSSGKNEPYHCEWGVKR